MDVVVKQGKGKHPDHPSRDPERQMMEAKGASRIKRGKLKFKSAGEEKDYYRAVRSNKFNVPGFPAFYPPEVPKSHGIGEGKPTEVLPCGHRWVTMGINGKGATYYKCRYGGEFPAAVIQPGFAGEITMTCPKPQPKG